MSDAIHSSISRRQLLEVAGTAAAAAAAASLASPGRAASAPPSLMPFQLTVLGSSKGPRYVFPADPGFIIRINSATGHDPLLGDYTYLDHVRVQLGVDGKNLSSDVEAVITAANGDGLFLRVSGIHRPPMPPYDLDDQGVFVITGGRGRFQGASGSGTSRVLRDPAKQELMNSYEGLISIPAAPRA